MEATGRDTFNELITIAAWQEITSARKRSLTTTPKFSTAIARITPGRIPAVIGGVLH
jgi:hypothetical protein